MAGEGMERRALSIVWRIENGGCINHGCEEFVFDSSKCRPFNLGRRNCFLRLVSCRSGSDANGTNIRCRFMIETSPERPTLCKWSFDSDDSPLASGNHLLGSNSSLDGELPNCLTQEGVFTTRKYPYLPHDTITVRCLVFWSDGEFAQAEDIFLLSRIHTLEQSFVWPIEGFSTLQLDEPVVTLVELQRREVEETIPLRFSLRGASLLASVVHCEISKVLDYPTALIGIKVSVLDDEEEAIECWEKNLELGHSNTGIAKLVSRKELLEKKSECLRGDVLSLLCAFTYVTGDCYSVIERTYLGPTNLEREVSRNDVIAVSDASCQTARQSVDNILISPDILPERSETVAVLLEDLLSLNKDHNLRDFELRSDDTSFPVHKLVLSARSPEFRDLFSGDMKNCNYLEVEDVDSHTLDRMLTFLYTGTVDPMQWVDTLKLCAAATKFRVQTLVQLCSTRLRSEVSVSNVCDILTYADLRQDQELASIAHEYVLRHFDEVMTSEEWRRLLQSDAYLAGNTMHQLYTKRLENMQVREE